GSARSPGAPSARRGDPPHGTGHAAARGQRLRRAQPDRPRGGPARPAARALRRPGRGDARRAGRHLDRVRAPRRHLVAAPHGRGAGRGLDARVVRRPRRRAQADLPRPARQRRRRPLPRRAGRPELRLVGRQAQPPPRQPQPRGRRPRPRHLGARLLHRPERRQAGHRPLDHQAPGRAVPAAAAAGGLEPALVERHRRLARRDQAARHRAGAAGRAHHRLPRGGVPRAVAGQGRRVPPGAPGSVGRLHGPVVRAQPQGHAHHHRRAQLGLPAQAGPHLAQRARRPLGGHRPGRAELPDRAPPVPEHAPAQPAPRAAAGGAVLRRARGRLPPVRAAALLRRRAAPPARRRCAAARGSGARTDLRL
ncbi:MAG: Linoleoyl-CoA desaturase, partial [uncultured Pseudonocardia sp.]